MKGSLAALCLLLCLAAHAPAQGVRANANANTGANVNTGVNTNVGAGANTNAGAGVNTNAGANVGANAGAAGAGNASPVTLEVHPGQTAKIVVGAQGEEAKGIDPFWKDLADIFSKLLTFVSIGVAVFLAWQQFNKNRDDRTKDRDQSERNRVQREEDVAQRRVELRWRKAELSRDILKGLHEDPYATDMMTMLDWDDREFAVKNSRGQPGKVEKISWEELWAALRIVERRFNDKEKFIRDCLDAFFGRMQTIEHYLSIDLIELEDVAYPFDYYVHTLDKNPIMFGHFVDTYHPRAASFVRRLKDFELRKGGAPPAEAAPPPGPEPAAYFMFDCPPGDERFYVRLEDGPVIAEARAILGGEYEWHLTGDIVGGEVYYNAPWEFHVEPSSVRFVEADAGFAHRMNEAVEGQLKKARAVFPSNNVWHTGGARLLAELPAWWFARERDGRQHEEQNALWMQGRVADVAAGGGAAAGLGGPRED